MSYVYLPERLDFIIINILLSKKLSVRWNLVYARLSQLVFNSILSIPFVEEIILVP